jgi:hypothetical protein
MHFSTYVVKRIDDFAYANALLTNDGLQHVRRRVTRTRSPVESLLRSTAAHETTCLGRARVSYGSEGWGFESLRAR